MPSHVLNKRKRPADTFSNADETSDISEEKENTPAKKTDIASQQSKENVSPSVKTVSKGCKRILFPSESSSETDSELFSPSLTATSGEKAKWFSKNNTSDRQNKSEPKSTLTSNKIEMISKDNKSQNLTRNSDDENKIVNGDGDRIEQHAHQSSVSPSS